MLNEKEKEFLIGLTKLTRDTGIAIGGCGCCGSPFLVEANKPQDKKSGYGSDSASNIKWLYPGCVYYDEKSKTIVK